MFLQTQIVGNFALFILHVHSFSFVSHTHVEQIKFSYSNNSFDILSKQFFYWVSILFSEFIKIRQWKPCKNNSVDKLSAEWIQSFACSYIHIFLYLSPNIKNQIDRVYSRYSVANFAWNTVTIFLREFNVKYIWILLESPVNLGEMVQFHAFSYMKFLLNEFFTWIHFQCPCYSWIKIN